ncbi:hypothetical protein APHNP_1746 [Anaplasma phagocytophilum str. ApNP]|nr:hypothetical protein APHNP_1746 [Anaplasma phagocytophilum str. ApNP]
MRCASVANEIFLIDAERTVVFIEACTADYVYHFIKIMSILY